MPATSSTSRAAAATEPVCIRKVTSKPHSQSSSSSVNRTRLPRFRAARAFYIILLLSVIFGAFAFRAHYTAASLSSSSSAAILKRSTALSSADDTLLRPLDSEDGCRKVNRVPLSEQCAFIHENCPIDEGGFSLYLDLYYCRLANVKPVAFMILISWLGVLFSTIGIAASDFFCENLESIAFILGMSENVAGVTLVAFGNGSPDVFSTFAAMSADSGTLAVGELFGAAGFITAVVAGSMALIQTFTMSRSDFMRDTGFFAVAAAFSLFFLWDGKLYLWECVSMVGFYVFYVAVVLTMGWWKSRRRTRKAKEIAARRHFVMPGEDLDVAEPYHDDLEEHQAATRASVSRGASFEDWAALERGPGFSRTADEDEDADEARDRVVMHEVASEMRLNRPTRGRLRSSTTTPIRPSLVGALEFQAVLKSLQKSQNYKTIPLYSRRFSDDPTLTANQQSDQLSTISDPASASSALGLHPAGQGEGQRMPANTLSVPTLISSGRTRAVSANDAAGLKLDPDLRRLSRDQGADNSHSKDHAGDDDFAMESVSSLYALSENMEAQSPWPSVNIEPATPRQGTTALEDRYQQDQIGGQQAAASSTDHSESNTHQAASDEDRNTSHTLHSLPRIVIPDEDDVYDSPRTISPFPQYRDSPASTLSAGARSPASTRPPSLFLPSPLAPVGSPEVCSDCQDGCSETPRKPLKWWPYNVLPPPIVIFHTLFPTFEHWSDRSWWAKCVGISAMPSVLLLTLTLPVVPVGEVKAAEDEEPVFDADSSFWKTPLLAAKDSHKHREVAIPPKRSNSGRIITAADQHNYSVQVHGVHDSGVGAANDDALRHSHGTALDERQEESIRQHHCVDDAPQLWNRWLLIVQLFLAPQFILLAVYIQTPSDVPPSLVVKLVLVCLLISLVLLIPVLLTTTPTHKPKIFHKILSNVGFVVSVAWISTVANLVVDGLKALAVICNMSHAIMGLTIFAVGNSLGDLVANVTLAQLGRPVMALSACFGGPLLNILLGIGLSGSYMLIAGAERRHQKHPDKHLKFKAYHIEVERTLIISGCTLLFTLVGLMIALPLNNYRFGKRIGWCLIALWTISTIANVVVEVTGYNKWD